MPPNITRPPYSHARWGSGCVAEDIENIITKNIDAGPGILSAPNMKVTNAPTRPINKENNIVEEDVNTPNIISTEKLAATRKIFFAR
ncbi:hypothetical protein RST01_18430 [Rummeliibacillus stabekisii]|nr:hypothetical protein RST01_18430 [Rummeliibacillus stabekisii]